MNEKKMAELLRSFNGDMGRLEAILIVDGGNGKELSFADRAVVLRNLEAMERTRLAGVRTWMAVAAFIIGLLVLLMKF